MFGNSNIRIHDYRILQVSISDRKCKLQYPGFVWRGFEMMVLGRYLVHGDLDP